MGEDFEFRPLTEGLGFHKKTVNIHEDSKADLSEMTSSGILPKARNTQNAPLGKMQNVMSTPLTKSAPQPQAFGRTAEPTAQPRATESTGLGSRVTQALGWSPSLPKKEIITTKKPTQIVIEPVAASWPAAIFDSTMVLGITLICSAVIFAVTGIDLSTLVDMLRNDATAQAAAVVLVLSVLEVYSVVCRTFFGKTLGEGSFDYRLGTPAAQNSVFYPALVAWRTLLIACTGFILLPLIGSALGRDITGLLTGVSLYSEKQ